MAFRNPFAKTKALGKKNREQKEKLEKLQARLKYYQKTGETYQAVKVQRQIRAIEGQMQARKLKMG